MKVKFAIAFYYIAISFLVVVAATIVVKLILWPPCTQFTENNKFACVIDPWSVAGLAGTVLSVAATMLAILGAVAVAAWWTSLNDQVTKHVTKLYSDQKKEIDERVNLLLATQQTRVEMLDQRAQDVEENMVDGLLTIGQAVLLEEWAEQLTERQQSPSIALRMSKSYLSSIEDGLDDAENALVKVEVELLSYDESIKDILSKPNSDTLNSSYPKLVKKGLNKWLKSYSVSVYSVTRNINDWDKALHWLTIAGNYLQKSENKNAQDIETQKSLERQIELFKPRVEILKENHNRLTTEYHALVKKITAASPQLANEE